MHTAHLHTAHGPLFSRLISVIILITSGGKSRPLRSFIAGIARAAAGFCEAAAGVLTLDVEGDGADFPAAAVVLGPPAAAPCFGAALTGRAINSS